MANDEAKSVNDKPEEQTATPSKPGRRKTTSRRAKTVLDEIAEQENRLRRETRTITAEQAGKPEPAAEKQLAEEYLTLQQKIDAVNRELTAIEATPGDQQEPEGCRQKAEDGQQATGNGQQGEAGSAASAPAGPAAGEEDFLKKQFFSVLEETSKVVDAPAAIEAETVNAGDAMDASAEAAVPPEPAAPVENSAGEAAAVEEVKPAAPHGRPSLPEREGAAPIAPDAVIETTAAGETVPPSAGQAEVESEPAQAALRPAGIEPAAAAESVKPTHMASPAIDSPETASDSSRDSKETPKPAESFFSEDFEEEENPESAASERKNLVERLCEIVDRALASETRRGIWTAFGVGCLILIVLVAMMWLFRILF